MNILKGVSLKLYSTMRLGGDAEYMAEIKDIKDLREALAWAEDNKKKITVIGEGSNIIWRDEGIQGLVLVNRIKGFNRIHEDSASATYEIGAGEDWDGVVGRLADKGLQGIECLSLIPGTTGATPVQNVGAYGQEIAGTLVSVDAYDTQDKKFVTILKEDCAFAYRDSRFKTNDKGRFIITYITLKLLKVVPHPPFYKSLQEYLDQRSITDYSVASIREAVTAIRSEKLPDWHKIANTGSFFANPIISAEQFARLKNIYPELTGWEHEGRYKIPAGWLIEKAGFKGVTDTETGMATWGKQALVLVNQNAKSTADLLKFKDKIVSKVEELFSITLEQEPELLP